MTDADDCMSTLAVRLLFMAIDAAGLRGRRYIHGGIAQGVRASLRKPTFTTIDACMHIYLHLHEGVLIKALNH